MTNKQLHAFEAQLCYRHMVRRIKADPKPAPFVVAIQPAVEVAPVKVARQLRAAVVPENSRLDKALSTLAVELAKIAPVSDAYWTSAEVR